MVLFRFCTESTRRSDMALTFVPSQDLTGNLRDDLRHATGPAHLRLDTRIMELEVATRSGLVTFLRGSASALQTLAPVLDSVPLPSCTPLRDAIAEDLSYLGVQPDPPPAGGLYLDANGALGAYYVIAGSRLGAQVLKRHHAKSTDPSILGADRYLTAPTGLGMWKALLYQLTEMNSKTNGAAVIAGALDAFDVYVRAFEALEPGEKTHDDE